MKSKIFKPILYSIVMVLSLHSIARSQETPPPAKERELEDKMAKMEQRLKDMQTRLDSMKIIADDNLKVIGDSNIYIAKAPRALKILPKAGYIYVTPKPKLHKIPPIPPMAAIEGFGYIDDTGKAFQGMAKSLNQVFIYDLSDKKIEERIKSGEIKEKIKTYSKSYTVGSGDKLQIDNRYGSVTINTWNKNEFKVDVEIKCAANDDDDAQKLLDGTSIADGKEGSTVSFTTKIENAGNNSWGIWSSKGKSTVRKLEVNYTVYMPSKNALTISNKYGSTIVPDFSGKLIINSAYGSFTAKTLTNADNEINTRYGSASIESLNGSDLNVEYGSLDLGLSNKVNATISYSSAKIDKIKNSGTINVKYGGGLHIVDLDKNLKSLSINSSYSSVLVGSNSGPDFDFDVSVSYGNFNYGDHAVNISNKTPDDGSHWTSTKTYKGHLGKGSSDRVVTIKSSFGNVKFD